MKKLFFILLISLTSCVTVKPVPSNSNVVTENKPKTTIVKKRTVLFYNRNYRQYRDYNRYYYNPYYRNRKY